MADPEQESHADSHDAFHLPPPSIWPPVLALGTALILVGLIVNLIVLFAGVLIGLAATGIWIRDARREFTHLPE